MDRGPKGPFLLLAFLWLEAILLEPCWASVYSSYGQVCTNKCHTTTNTNYNWCKTSRTSAWKHDWDYCSSVQGFDYKNKKCITDCDEDGKTYKWCKLHGGGWGYCSNAPEEEIRSSSGMSRNVTISAHGIPCKSNCKKETSYAWCEIERKHGKYAWDYCSLAPGFDYKGNKCFSDCDYNGELFKWCYVNKSNKKWGYC